MKIRYESHKNLGKNHAHINPPVCSNKSKQLSLVLSKPSPYTFKKNKSPHFSGTTANLIYIVLDSGVSLSPTSEDQTNMEQGKSPQWISHLHQIFYFWYRSQGV